VAGIVLIAFAAVALLYHAVDMAYHQRGRGLVPRAMPRLALGTALLPLLLATWIAFAPPPAIRDLMQDAAAVVEV
jgi:hypothetical protein